MSIPVFQASWIILWYKHFYTFSLWFVLNKSAFQYTCSKNNCSFQTYFRMGVQTLAYDSQFEMSELQLTTSVCVFICICSPLFSLHNGRPSLFAFKLSWTNTNPLQAHKRPPLDNLFILLNYALWTYRKKLASCVKRKWKNWMVWIHFNSTANWKHL